MKTLILVILLTVLAGCSSPRVLMVKCDHLQGDYYFCEKPQ